MAMNSGKDASGLSPWARFGVVIFSISCWIAAVVIYVLGTNGRLNLQESAVILIPLLLIFIGIVTLGMVRSLLSSALLFAFGLILYFWSLLGKPSGEPFLIMGVVISTLYAAFLFGRERFGTNTLQEIDEIRESGPGDDDEPHKRHIWIEAQSRRAYWITTVAITVIGLVLAFYVYNHMTGSFSNSSLHWQTHAARLKAGNTYLTKKGDTLAGVAAGNQVAIDQLAEVNPAALLVIEQQTPSALDASKVLTTTGEIGITLETAAQKLDVPVKDVALGFSSASLKEAQTLNIPVMSGIDPRQWFDWILWALIGVSAYLLLEVARYYREIPKGNSDFLGETTWYYAQFLTGPLIAFVVLLFFTNINLNVLSGEGGTAIALDFSKFPPDLLFVPAFLLGFYSRVARKVLDQIMQAIFKGAWLAAYGEFTIAIKGQPDDNVVVSEQAVILETSPATSVNWLATEGTISAIGAFKAPQVEDKPKDVIITAVATGGANITTAKVIKVVPHKFIVKIVENKPKQIVPDDSRQLTIDPLPAQGELGNIAWNVSKTTPETVIDPTTGGQVTMKIPKGLAPATRIKVTATYRGYSQELELEVAELKNINAQTDGKSLEENSSVATGTEIDFNVEHNLSEAEVGKIEWSKDPPDDNLFAWTGKPAGAAASGKVPNGATPGIEINIKASYESLETSYKFKIAQ